MPRTVILISVVVLSTFAIAGSKNVAAISGSSLPSTAVPTTITTPWFTGMRAARVPQLAIGSVQLKPTSKARLMSQNLSSATCGTMRMYKVKRTERLSDGDTGVRGYTTCEIFSNFQVRSAVGVQKLQVDPQ